MTVYTLGIMEIFSLELVDIIEKFGITVGGLFIVTGLLIYVIKLNHKDQEAHRLERQDWKNSIERMQDRSDATLKIYQKSNERMEDRTIDALEELTVAIREKKI